MKVRKAVIPAAGFGTRFLPVTKTIPKEMLPVVDKPVIHYIVESLVASGIEQIVLVTSSSKKALEDYFDSNFELEHTLRAAGKTELLDSVNATTTMAEVVYVRQRQPLGNGHAVLVARSVIGDEPFVMLWGDDILVGTPPVPRQLIEVASQYGGPVIGVRKVARDFFQKYGMVKSDPIDDRVGVVRSVIEKPKPEESPSDLAAIGGYVLTPDIFDLLETTRPGLGGEIYLADAVARLIESRPVYSYQFEGKRYDAGDKLEFLRANIELALNRPDLGPGLRALLAGLNVAEPAST